MIKYKLPITIDNAARTVGTDTPDNHFAPTIAANREPAPEVEADQSITIRIRNGDDRPKAEWVRGSCPECGECLVSNMYYVGGWGYLIVWECWGSLGENPQCSYRRVL